MTKTHVFISYCRDNQSEVRQLHDDLVNAGETVWWDQDILPGQIWKTAIHQAMKDGYAVVLCLSREAAARNTSGIYPEAFDAIEAYRNYSPGEIFLIPVRLSECEIPPIPIHANLMLDGLQHADLFPEARRAAGMQQLVKALRAAPHHPHGDEPPPRVALRAYLEFLKKDTGSIAIRGLQVGSGKAHLFPISDLYISLTTTVDPGRRAAGKGTDEDDQRESAAGDPDARGLPLEQVLGQPRLVIVGDPGAGKTTFLRRVAFALCQRQRGEAPPEDPFSQSLPNDRLPILIRLSDVLRCRQRAGPTAPILDESPAWLPFYLAQISEHDYYWGLDRDFFHQQLSAGRCMVLLDGLDEAPDRVAREMLSRMIESAAAKYDRCPFVVTSRPPAYTEGTVLPDFTHARIDPLADAAVRAFLTHWCDAVYAGHSAAAREHFGELLQALDLRPDIREMVRNPVMLTALAVMHWNERRLPEQRADLYQSIITWLSRSREQRPGRPSADHTVDLLGELALAMQDHPEGRQTQVDQKWAAKAIADRFSDEKPLAAAEAFLHDEELDSGIVVGRGGQIRFWHLTFQEYLAAKTIAGLRERKQVQLLLGPEKKLYLPEWREAGLLLAGILGGLGRDRVDGLVEAILEDLFEPRLADQEPELADQARCAGLLGAIRRDLAPYDYQPAAEQYDDLMRNVMAIFDPQASQTVPTATRVAAAEALGRAGDPRPGVGLRTDRPGVPDILWCDVPGGTLMMGSREDDEGAYEDEHGPAGKPLPVEIRPFRLAAYPVTCAQFRPFVTGDGYRNIEYWTESGWKWKEENDITKPRYWDESRWNIDNHPVVGVSWYETVAWCCWMTQRLRDAGELSSDQQVRLPTEAEWEWAARGPEGLKYPWGNSWQDDVCNGENAGIEHTSAVGVFPAGASRWLAEETGVACHDLSGNVYDWCVTKWRQSYEEPADDSPEGNALRVLRGGAYFSDQQDVRCAFRFRYNPVGRFGLRGFRCAQ